MRCKNEMNVLNVVNVNESKERWFKETVREEQKWEKVRSLMRERKVRGCKGKKIECKAKI